MRVLTKTGAGPRRIAAIAAFGLAATLGLYGMQAQAAEPENVLGNSVPSVTTDPDVVPITVGTTMRASADGTIQSIRYYRGPNNRGPHVGGIYAKDGTLLRTGEFANESSSGWQVLNLPSALRVTAGTEFTVAVYMPRGQYSTTHNYRWPQSSKSLVATSGVYRYGSGLARPTQTWASSNYFVDVNFNPSGSQPSPSPSQTATASPSPTPTRPSPTTSPTSSPTPTASPTSSLLNLPRIPWDGGPAYWSKFPNAKKGGWDKDTFFPIGVWYGNFSTASEIEFDKSKGINTYVGMWSGTDFRLFSQNGVYWLGTGLKNQDDTSGNNPGIMLDDEADGYITPVSAAKQHLANVRKNVGPNRFSYANFTQLVVGSDMGLADQESFVNDFTDAVSVDMYWYSIPFCDWTPYRGGLYAVPVPKETCRTAHSYGLTEEALRLRDAKDGKLQPTWLWIENFNGMSGQSTRPYITPDQLRGAAMSTIIHGARGLFYFNQSLTGSCQSANVLREAQVNPNSTCGRQYRTNIDAMGVVNNQVKNLAPVLNTQSYQWNFGPNLDTMLKVKDGYAYIFAMTEGTTGQRTYTLPAGVSGTSVEVLNENRTLSVSGGRFSDSFAKESDYHIYRIKL